MVTGSIISPGRLDTLHILHQARCNGRLNETSIVELIISQEKEIGKVICGRIGVKRGYREDWSLIEIEEQRRGSNGTWWDYDTLKYNSQFVGNDSASKFTGQITGAENPKSDGSIWFKDGAQSRWTVGTCSGVKAELFVKGSWPISDPDKDIHPENIKKGSVLVFKSGRSESFAEGGDSGAAVFRVDEDGQGVVFGGSIVSTFKSNTGGYDMTFVVPQKQLFAQIEEVTGAKWRVF